MAPRFTRIFAFTSAAALLALATSAASAADIRVLLRDGEDCVWVRRAEPATAQTTDPSLTMDEVRADRLTAVVIAQVEGPTAEEAAAGLSGLFPPGSLVDAVVVKGGQAVVSLTLPTAFLEDELDEVLFEEIVGMTVRWADLTPGLQAVSLRVRAPSGSSHQALETFLPVLPPPSSKPEDPGQAGPISASTGGARFEALAPGQQPARGTPQPTGALTGASIFLTPSHGWFFSTSLDRWATQRPNTNNIIEDLNSGESWLQFLAPYLWNAGARVYTTRERDLQTNMVIVDNGSADHTETGTWTTESSSSSYNGSHRVATTVTGAPTATSTFTPTVPEDGYYAVYVWYRTALSGTTTTDAEITINHTGGSTVWTQNETRDGFTWKYVGTYHFNAGANQSTGSVVISNSSATAGNVVVADAVRFGGGMGDMVDPADAQARVSGEPRWEESGRYFPGFMGKDDWASFGTVTGMPRYAAWENESWETNSIYLSVHTNAFDGTARGTITYAYSSGGFGGPFNGVAGGDVLRDFVQAEVINDIHAGWDAGWQDRGVSTANFGEINPNNNSEMPGALVELAFHDNPVDADALEDPNFRRLAARAMCQGIVKFYNSFYGFTETTLFPEPPTDLRVGHSGPGQVTVAWGAPPFNSGDGLLGDAATGYRVYKSSDGKGFDNGTDVAGTSTTIGGLTPGQTLYVRVTATNAGGESFPTETLAVNIPSSGTTPILIVNGFDRIGLAQNIVEDDPHDTQDLHRGFLWLMNTYDYVIAHAEAISAHGDGFDSCANEAIISGQVALGNYEAVVWILGEESTADSTFDATEQSLVATYLANGGKIFVTGAEIGWDLEAQGNGISFYQGDLRGDYVSDDAGVYAASGVVGTIFDGVSLSFDDGTSIYDVNFPDTLAGINGSVLCMTYDAGGSPGAAVQYPSGLTGGQVVMLGFPFETITSPSVRGQVMAAALDFLGISTGDSTPPAAPTNLVATGGDGQIDLNWDDNTEPDLAGYNVHRSTTGGGPYSQINGALVATSDFVDTGVVNGTTYHYVVTAVDTSSNESANSNEDSATPQAQDPAEMRVAVMTVFDDINDTASIQGWVDEIAGLNYNAIAIHTRYRGDATYFPNKTDSTFPNSEPRSPSAGSIDALEEFTTRGHAAGLQVYAYVNTHLVTDGADTHPDPNHVVNVHPEWRTYYYNGGSPIVQTTAHDSGGLWLDPGLPEVRTNIATICGDIMMNYDCDGIILDRIRYPQTNFSRTDDFGFHPDAIDRFNAQFGKSGTPDPNDPDWILFRQQQITATVQAIHSVITSIDVNHILLAYPIGRFNDAINFNYQDWPTWLNSENLDGCLPQIYTSDNGIFSTRCDEHIAAYGGPRHLGVTTNAFQAGIDVDGQIEITRTKGMDGTSPFRHGVMQGLGYFADLANAYVNPAPWPAMPWVGVDGEAPAPPANLVATPGDGQISLDWDDNIELDVSGYNVLRATTTGGPYTQVNGALLPASDFVDTGLTNGTTYHYVVTAVDTNSNESGNSDEESATPVGGGGDVTNLATADFQTDNGSITSGTSVDTHSQNDAYEILTEEHTGGKPSGRQSLLSHTWTFNVASGASYTFSVEAFHEANSEGDDFTFSYSLDNVGYTPMLTVTKTADDDTLQSFVFPEDVAGTLYVRVEDTDRTVGNGSTDSISVDEMFVLTSGGGDVTPPAPPTNLVATGGDGQVSLNWDDNSEPDLAGYNVLRSTTMGGPYSQINGSLVVASMFTDTGVNNGTTYHYVVNAEDTSGNTSGLSNEDSATPQSGGGGTDVIVDNDDGAPDYVETGTWTTSGSTGYNGLTYRFATAGAAATATWTANLLQTGTYEVFVWYREGTNRATLAKYEIATNTGPQTVFVDQQVNGQVFFSLGTFDFNAGNNTITLDALGSSGGSVVIADAVRFTLQASATTMHVDSIVASTVNVGQGNKRGRAEVTVLDNLGTPVVGADVTGTFTGDFNETQMGTTDGNGVATVDTVATKKGGVSFTFCVDDITHPSLTYSPGDNVVNCGSL